MQVRGMTNASYNTTCMLPFAARQHPLSCAGQAGGGTDDAAVQDALECLACIASASEEGRQVALQSQALAACAFLLQSASNSKQLAVRLLVALLDTPQRAQVFPGEPRLPSSVGYPLICRGTRLNSICLKSEAALRQAACRCRTLG